MPLHWSAPFMRRLWRALAVPLALLPGLALVSWLTLVPGLAQARTTVAPDALLQQAYDAWQAGQPARLEPIATALRGHPLAAYVDYWRVLAAPGDRDIQAYLNRYPNTYLADRLRGDWVLGLAKRGDWALLAPVADAVVQPSDTVSCWGIRARIQQREPRALEQLLHTHWLQWRDLPEGCAAAARDLAAAGQLMPAAVWHRARNLVAMGETSAARRTMALLPPGQAPTPKQLDMALGTPKRWLAAPGMGARPATRGELTGMALARVAQENPVAALGWLRQKSLNLDAGQRSYVHALLGLQAARALQSDARAWFALAQPADLSDEHRIWWTRAALRVQHWGDVRVAVAGMSPQLRQQPDWRYWQGRAEAALGEPERARRLWTPIARDPGFYGRLAREALGRPDTPPPFAELPKAELDAIARQPGLVRAVALQRVGLWQEASAEWTWAARRFNDRQLAAAASHARRLGLWSRALDNASQMHDGHPLALRYPVPYLNLVRPAARGQGVDEGLMYGVMHQESRFAPNTVSKAGARGLMQLMPTTAQWLAGEMRWPGFQMDWLMDPQRSIALGSRYLKQLIGSLGGSAVLSVAAYNAGPSRANAWRASLPLEGAIYAETIPIDETRDYVKRVMLAAVHYGELLGTAPQQLTGRLGQVPASRNLADPQATPAAASAQRYSVADPGAQRLH